VAGPDVGILLRRHRRAAGLTLEALADASGVSVRAISDLERGRSRGPQPRTMAALADALRLPAEARSALLAAARDARLARVPELTGRLPLPPRLPDFVGRSAELAELARLADPATRPALVVLSGSGGLGKSALAVEAAHRAAAAYPGGVLHLDLRGLDPEPVPPVELLGRALAALGLRELPPGLDDRAAAYRERLAEQAVLVVLDNAGAEAQVRPLLPGAGASTVLVTSRRLLTGLPADRRLALLPLPDDDAVALLARVGGAPDGAALRQVARLCGHWPLALRIAGNRLLTRPAWTAADLAARLADGDHRLRHLVAGDLQVDAALALSYEQLDDDGRRVFRRLSLAAGGAGAELVGVLAGIDAREAEHVLDELVELSLLVPLPGDRAGFHDLVAVYAAGRFAAEEPEPDRRERADRARDWLLASASAAGQLFEPDAGPAPVPGGLAFADRAAAERWLVLEQPNWTSALRAAAAAGADATVVAVAESMHWFSDRQAFWPAWVDVFGASAAAAGRLADPRLEAVHVNYLSWALSMQRRLDEAVAAADRAAGLARAAGDLEQEAWAHVYRANAQRFGGGPPEELVRHYLAGAKLFDRLGDHGNWVGASLGAMRALGDAGRYGDGLGLVEECLARLDGPAGDLPQHFRDWYRTHVRLFSGRLHWLAGDLTAAEAATRAGVAGAHELGVESELALAHLQLGRVLRDRGRADDARAALLTAREHRSRAGVDGQLPELDAELAALDAPG
jgi:transcriptional regulator with XRE-family HTH domain/tetratricopeptide (TPR) repeat protein